MGVPVDDLTRDIDAATRRLLDDAAGLDDAGVRAPSRLPGWSRAHLLSHIARNADGLVNLLGWVHGSRTPMYASGDARDRDIEAGSARTAAELLADVHASADRFSTACTTVPADGWQTPVEFRGGRRRVAADIPFARLVEVEVHHVDLDVGYTQADWPERFTDRLLDDLVAGLQHRGDLPAFTVRRPGEPEDDTDQFHPVVSGPAADLAAWLTGRAAGASLLVTPPGALPEIPPWL